MKDIQILKIYFVAAITACFLIVGCGHRLSSAVNLEASSCKVASVSQVSGTNQLTLVISATGGTPNYSINSISVNSDTGNLVYGNPLGFKTNTSVTESFDGLDASSLSGASGTVTLVDSSSLPETLTCNFTVPTTSASDLGCVIVPSSTTTPVVQQAVTFNFSGSGGLPPYTFSNFIPGDGGTPGSITKTGDTTANASASYSTSGPKAVTLTIADSLKNTASCSNHSITVADSSGSAADAPTNLVGHAISRTKIELFWQPPTATVDHYELQNNYGGIENITTVGGGNTTIWQTPNAEINPAAPPVSFKIRAVYASGPSDWAQISSDITLLKPYTCSDATAVNELFWQVVAQDPQATERIYHLEQLIEGGESIRALESVLRSSDPRRNHQSAGNGDLFEQENFLYRLIAGTLIDSQSYNNFFTTYNWSYDGVAYWLRANEPDSAHDGDAISQVFGRLLGRLPTTGSPSEFEFLWDMATGYYSPSWKTDAVAVTPISGIEDAITSSVSPFRDYFAAQGGGDAEDVIALVRILFNRWPDPGPNNGGQLSEQNNLVTYMHQQNWDLAHLASFLMNSYHGDEYKKRCQEE